MLPVRDKSRLKSEEDGMDGRNAIQLFEDKRIRTAWDKEAEEWCFPIVDVVAVLTDQPSLLHHFWGYHCLHSCRW
jgi:hypothetical protein